MGIIVLPTQAYSLRISKQPAAFSVLSFEGAETISEPYHFEIEFTCARARLPIADVLGKRAKFAIEPVDPNAGLAAELAAIDETDKNTAVAKLANFLKTIT